MRCNTSFSRYGWKSIAATLKKPAERNHMVLYLLALIAAGAFVFLGPDALQARPCRLVP